MNWKTDRRMTHSGHLYSGIISESMYFEGESEKRLCKNGQRERRASIKEHRMNL